MATRTRSASTGGCIRRSSSPAGARPGYGIFASYLGRPTAVRAGHLTEADFPPPDLLRDEDKAVRRIAERVPRRTACCICAASSIAGSAIAPTPATSSTAPPERWPARAVSATANALPEATIVIPSRDRRRSLGACMETLRTHHRLSRLSHRRRRQRQRASSGPQLLRDIGRPAELSGDRPAGAVQLFGAVQRRRPASPTRRSWCSSTTT